MGAQKQLYEAQEIYQENSILKEESERDKSYLNGLLRDKDNELFRVEQILEGYRQKDKHHTTTLQLNKTLHNIEKEKESARKEIEETNQRVTLLEGMVGQQKQKIEKLEEEVKNSEIHRENLMSVIQVAEKTLQSERDQHQAALHQFNAEKQKSSDLKGVVEQQQEKLKLLLQEMVAANRANAEKIIKQQELLVRFNEEHAKLQNDRTIAFLQNQQVQNIIDKALKKRTRSFSFIPKHFHFGPKISIREMLETVANVLAGIEKSCK